MPQGLDNPYEIDEKGNGKADFRAFSDRLRKSYPQQFGQFTDDQIAEAARKTPGFKLIDLPTTSTPPGVTPQQWNAGMGKKQERAPTPSEIIIHGARWLPDVFSGAAGLAMGSKATPTGMAAAGVAGAVGKGLERAIQYPFIQEGQLPPDISTETREIVEGYPKSGAGMAGDIALEGLKQAGMEGVGRGIGGVLGGVFRSAAHVPPGGAAASREVTENITVREANQKYDLGLTAPEIAGTTKRGAVGRAFQRLGDTGVLAIARSLRRKHDVTVRAVEALESEFYKAGPPTTELSAGAGLREAWTRAKSSFDDTAESLYAAARNSGEASGVMVDMRPVKREAGRMLMKNRELRAQFADAAKMPSEAQKVLEGIAASDDLISFNVVDEMRSELRKKVPTSARNSMIVADPKQREVGATARHMQEYFFNALDSATAADPVLKKSWDEARTYYRQGVELFGQTIVNTLNAPGTIPEKVVRAVNPSNLTDIRAMKEAVFKYATSVGDQQLADTSWGQFQQQFLRTHILNAPERTVPEVVDVFGMGKRLATTSRESLDEIFSDPRGREMLANVESIGKAMERVDKTVGKNQSSLSWLLARAVAAGAGGAYGIPISALAGFEALSGAISLVAHNKTATKFFVDGIENLPKDTGVAIPLVLRAISLAQKTAEMPIKIAGPMMGPVEDFGYGNFGPSVRTAPPPAGPPTAAPVRPSPLANPY